MKKKLTRYEKLCKERRFVAVPIDIHLLGEILIDGTGWYTAEGLPKDAIFVAADRDIQQQAFQFIYLHESFESVPEGGCGPNWLITLTRHDKARPV